MDALLSNQNLKLFHIGTPTANPTIPDPIMLSEDLRIGTVQGTGADAFGRIADLEVDARGRVYVLERDAQEVRVFDRDGSHVRTFGGKGSGPGEFEGAVGMDWGPQGHLWILDARSARLSVFDTAGSFVTSHPRRGGVIFPSWRGGFDNKGRIYDIGIRLTDQVPNPQVLVRLDSGFAGGDTIPLPTYGRDWFVLPDSPSRIAVPFSPALVYRFDPRGYLWFGITAEYRIYQRNLHGDTVRIVQRDYEPVPVSAEERGASSPSIEWFERNGGKVDRTRIPANKPALNGFFIDASGRLWVRPSARGGQVGTALDVFDASGRYVARVEHALSISLQPVPIVLRDTMYAVVLDELDVPFVIRAVVKFP